MQLLEHDLGASLPFLIYFLYPVAQQEMEKFYIPVSTNYDICLGLTLVLIFLAEKDLIREQLSHFIDIKVFN